MSTTFTEASASSSVLLPRDVSEFSETCAVAKLNSDKIPDVNVKPAARVVTDSAAEVNVSRDVDENGSLCCLSGLGSSFAPWAKSFYDKDTDAETEERPSKRVKLNNAEAETVADIRIYRFHASITGEATASNPAQDAPT